jgi:hypothetical protein
MVRPQDVVIESATVQPIPYLRAQRRPQQASTHRGVRDHSIVGLRSRLRAGATFRNWWQFACRRHAGAGGEFIDGSRSVTAADRLHQIDRVASVVSVAGPATPPFVATVVSVHRDRRVVIVVVAERTVPSTALAIRNCELIEQCPQVGSIEDIGDRPPVTHVASLRGRRGADLTRRGHALVCCRNFPESRTVRSSNVGMRVSRRAG